MVLNSVRNPAMAYVASFPPRECGIATYTFDLIGAVEALSGIPGTVVAMNNRAARFAYDDRVRVQIAQNDRPSYAKAARELAQMPIDAINVQHEYGLFGGTWGEYLLDFYRAAKQPIITTFHTALPKPDPGLRRVTQTLAAYSAQVIVLAESAIPILTRDHGIPAEKIKMIPHGAPTANQSAQDQALIKSNLGYPGRMILSTFGLINPNKGIEFALRALPEIIVAHPDALYLIIGETHPDVRANEGEKYREYLESIVRKLDLGEYVEFLNRYLPLEDIVKYLHTTDVYIVPYLNPFQIVSGTLAYAAGAGKAIVSTPSTYAREVLADGRGVIVPFRDSKAIAKQVNRIMANPDARREMEQRVYAYSQGWTWNSVAEKYLDVFNKAVSDELLAVAA